MLEEEKLATGASPTPETGTVWGLVGALSATMTVAVRVPAATGLKVTLMLQEEPAATELPQLFVWIKSLALAPETATLVTFRSALPRSEEHTSELQSLR